MRLLGLCLALALAACRAPEEERSIYLTSELARERWLPPVEAGSTTRTDLDRHFGPPASFADGVAVYRLLLVDDPAPLSDDGYDDGIEAIELQYDAFPDRGGVIDFDAIRERRELLLEEGHLIGLPEGAGEPLRRHLVTRDAEFHLVVVFDRHGRVRRHELVRVGP